MAAKPKVVESPSKEVAKKPAQEVAGADDDFFGPDAGAGLENVSARDIVIPRLTILQKLSPQLDKNLPNFIKDAQEGDFCDTSTGDIWRDGIEIIPCYFARVYLEWRPGRQGLAANHGMDGSLMATTKRDDKNRNVLPNGNYLVETAQYYVLNLSADGRRAFIPLSSTQLKASQQWMTLITGERRINAQGQKVNVPLWYRTWQASAVDQRNQEGSWKGWKFTPGNKLSQLDNGRQLLAEATRFHDDAAAGLVRGDVDEESMAPGKAKESDPF